MDSKPNNRGFFARSKYQHKKCAVITIITARDGERESRILTHIDEAAGAALAELPGLVGEADLDNAGDVTGRGLHPDGVTRDQLGPDRDCAEDDLEPVKEVLSDDDDGLTSGCPSLTGGDGLDLGDEGGHGVEAGVGAVQSADLAAVLGVVMDEHVL